MCSCSAPMKLGLLPLLALFAIGCHQSIPPPPPPRTPDPPTRPPASDEVFETRSISAGYVSFTTDVPARVVRRLGRYDPVLRASGPRFYNRGYGAGYEVVCERTPCTKYIPYGTHMFDFISLSDVDRRSVAWVTTNQPDVTINHTLGQERSSTGIVLGSLMIAAGLALIIFPFGLDLDRSKPVPPIMLGTGIGAVFGGIGVMSFLPGIHQEGSTSTNIPPPPPPSLAKGLSLKLEF